MAEVIGYDDNYVLVANGNNAAILDTEFNIVVETGLVAAMKKKRNWSSKATCEILDSSLELASAALSTLEIKVITASGRLYTIPTGVQAEAKKALEWHAEHHRGGTPVGLNTARTLAKGGQIGLEKIRHIAKYFPRHEVDKKANGYEPGEDGFPSNGRIAWALWGGDAGWRWAQAIVERENNKSITADGFSLGYNADDHELYSVEETPYSADLSAFEQALLTDDDEVAIEFIARVRMDGSGIDRLYKVDLDGSVYVWDGGYWDTLGVPSGDVYTYDNILDDVYDTVEKDYFTIDAQSAITISALLQQNPYQRISVDDIDDYEASLVKEALPEIDWIAVDYAMTAATAPASSTPATPQGDGQYTGEERSQNASKQVRDATGRFSSAGTKVTIKGGKPGTITNVDKATGNVTVQHADGTASIVPAKLTQAATGVTSVIPTPTAGMVDTTEPLDTSGILAEPRTPATSGQSATLPGTLPALSSSDTSQIINGWSQWVGQQRAGAEAAKPQQLPSSMQPTKYGANPKTPFNRVDVKTIENNPAVKKIEGLTGLKLDLDPYKHPMLANFLNKTVNVGGKATTPNAIWYQPVTSSGAETGKTETPVAKTDAGVELTPETSDVQPLFLALVLQDDPRAVSQLVSIVPASTTSPEPMTFVRKDKSWVKDVGILQDLRSATPPAMVPLDADTLKSVMSQIDGTGTTASAGPDHALMVLWGPRQDVMAAVVAGARPPSAHNIDKNKGNAEKLRRYWVHGKGAAKIRWGTGGDWKRCVRHLSKYLGERAKGYCQLRHKEATGMYTSTHAKMVRGRNNSVQEFIMEEVLTKNYGTPTEVTEKDMLMPIEDIHAENDNLYDHDWTPEPEIENLLKDDGCINEMCNFSTSEHSNEDPCWDGYKQIGYKDKNGKHVPNCVKASAAVVAAGPHSGAAERLRIYWTTGKGGMKIRWGTPGDWKRCVRHLEKFMGPRAKGYCELRHHDATGLYTGDKNNPGGNGHHKHFSVENAIDAAILTATGNHALERAGLLASASAVGATFSIPLVIPEDTESGDGRKFTEEAITWRELPLPLLWQIKTADGHQGSVVVGRIDHMERIEGGIGNAHGVFDTGAYGREAERLIRNGFIRGVSADMDQFEASEEATKELQDDELEKLASPKILVNKARVMAVTIVPKPAFQECKIIIISDEPNNENQEEDMIPNGVYVDDADELDAAALVACGFIAGAIPVDPPSSWFENPKLNKATPLTVTEEGRVFGHIAAWHVDHIGMAFGTRPPRSKSNYAYFHTGVVRTSEGKDVPVGQLTLAGGHASIEASAAQAVKHYDDTASSFADVHAGEDAHGIWVSGALRPGTTPEQIRAIRASAPSGDWRPIKGSLELVAVCQVNVPGFPIARARVASGQVTALVAAGAATLAKMKHDPIADLIARVQKLEQFDAPADFSSRVEELAARVRETAEFAISTATRKKLAEEGKALPDGSYPIRNTSDLKNAIHAYGRATEADKPKVKKHIIKRAHALGQSKLIPENWVGASSESLTASAEGIRARLAEVKKTLG